MSKLVIEVKKASYEAMKSGDKERLSTLRLLVAELEKEKVQHKLSEITGLTDEQALTVINRQIKKLDKEIEAYVAVNRGTEKQEQEKLVLKEFLPKQLTQEEVEQVVLTATEESANMGEAMKKLSFLKGKADMAFVSQLVKRIYSK